MTRREDEGDPPGAGLRAAAARSALWIGGPPGAGKSTVALRLARAHGLRWYGADAHTWRHRDVALAAGNRAALRWEAMTAAQRWSAGTEDLLAMSLHRERGAMILADVDALPASPLTVAEGTPIAPRVVGAGPRALWLLPTAEVQRARLAERRLAPGVARLYAALRKEIEREVAASGAAALVVDGSRGAEAIAAEVARAFSPALRAGPTAASAAERRRLLRAANRAIVRQYEDFVARPWASRDALETVRPFACECGRTDCAASVELAVPRFPPPPDATSPPLLAAGHGRAAAR